MAGYRAALLALDNPLPLFIAALLHDTGKQWHTLRGGERAGHSETGAERMREICARLGTTPTVAENVEFLVRHHLLLAETSRLRDLGQPATISDVARIVGDGERLRMLYLLTWADTSAVGPGVLTEMNARLLEELFLRTEAYLARARELPAPPDAQMRADAGTSEGEPEARLHSVRQRLQRQFARERALLEKGGANEVALREHVEAMPAAYLLNTPPEKVGLHVIMLNRLQEGVPVVVDMRALGPDAEQTELTVVTRDDPRPGLFAKLTGALLSCDANLHAAQAFTRTLTSGGLATGEGAHEHAPVVHSDRVAIDTLRVDYKHRALGPDKRVAVEEAIRRVLGGETTVAELLARRRRPFDPVQRVRSLHVEAASPRSGFTLVDVEAPDESGVVYRLASLFTQMGWNIHAARISSWGGNARCAFYLTGTNGEPLDCQQTQTELKQHLPQI
jgi:[protein-PII] uridylyltransferase